MNPIRSSLRRVGPAWRWRVDSHYQGPGGKVWRFPHAAGWAWTRARAEADLWAALQDAHAQALARLHALLPTREAA